MATSIASAASICPRGAVVHRGVTRRRGARAAAARQMTRAAATYDEVFDGQTGQMEKVLSQAVETASAGGLDWRYRMGVPEDGVEVKPNKVLLVHGAGLVAYTYSKLMKEMQEAGFVCCAPDMPGHGGTSKPAPSAFKYDAAAYSAALEAFISEMGLAADEPVDLVVSGFFTSQPSLFRRVVIMNAPLSKGHKLPDPLGVYTRPFGMGKGAAADVYKLAYYEPNPRRATLRLGNEFAIPEERMGEYVSPYDGAEGEAARAALEATCTASDFKGLMEQVTKALQVRGGPKVRVLWGTGDKYLGDQPMYDWANDVRASFDCLRKVGHMPHEDFPQETAKFITSFFESELKVSALTSVRLGKGITKDDDFDR